VFCVPVVAVVFVFPPAFDDRRTLEGRVDFPYYGLAVVDPESLFDGLEQDSFSEQRSPVPHRVPPMSMAPWQSILRVHAPFG